MNSFFGRKGKVFRLIVDSTGNNGSGSIVHCKLVSGRIPQEGGKFCIERSGKIGTITTSTSLAEAISELNVISIGGGFGNMNASVSFLTPDMAPHNFLNGDIILNI
ncbi:MULTISPECIES: hypothetical protein [unclassified Saccharicrinis]|uniref:hypothetical protein n=1 Tax=unclassified Saccharicrinis TaxID=2646859 RepID=UPI003D3392C6